nr:hypothetical protein [Tanacetum cinerariifolium]
MKGWAWSKRSVPLGGRFLLVLIEDWRPLCTEVKGKLRRLAIFVPFQVGCKSGGRFVSCLSFSPAPAFKGPLPSIFLPLLLLSLSGASSNPTTLSRYLRALGNLVRSGGVTSLVCSSLGSISSSSSGSGGKHDGVTGGLSVVLMFGIRGGVEKPGGGVVSLPLVMPEK